MNKKKIIIITSIITILLIIIGVYINQSQDKQSNTEQVTGSISKDDYYIEKGIEDPAAVAKLAVESFINQDKSEPGSSRTDRLNKYFTSDSPVYEYGLNNLDDTTNKTSAAVTSITSCEEQEGGNWCLIVKADTKFQSSKESYTKNLTYWITLKEAGAIFKAYDMGLW